MITVVMTSCGRLNLLKRTMDSFLKFNTYPINEFVIIEDSCKLDVINEIKRLYPFTSVVINEKNIGQVASIDKGYSFVKTPYIFHLEDDWEFYREGFIEKSLAILEHDKKIMQVWLRELYDTNTHPIEPEIYTLLNIKYRYVQINALGGNWHGFTWNPGLRRLSDYKLVAPFSSIREDGDFNALTECHIGQKFFELGFRAVILEQGYIKHIGYGQQVKH